RSLEALYRGLGDEDAMMQKLAYCVFGVNATAPSTDTFLHAFVPRRHVDHLHCDAILAIAASRDGEALTAKIFEEEDGGSHGQRPGLDLGRKVARWFSENPRRVGVVLGGHGLVTWGESSRECYEASLSAVNRAARAIAEAQAESRPTFGSAVLAP